MSTKLAFTTMLLVVTQLSFSESQQAQMADGPLGSFYESFGINMKIDGSSSNFTLHKAKLLELGIRNVRTATGVQGVRPIDSTVCERIRELGRAGIQSTILWREFQTWNQVMTTTKSLLPYVVAVEGPNESDIGWERFSYNGQTFPVGTRTYQHDLYTHIKSDMQTKGLDIILTSVSWGMKYQDPYTTGGATYSGLGNMETYYDDFNMDYGNMHSYTASSNAPGSAMGGWHVFYARKAAPTLPLMATEGGYNTSTNPDGGISEWAHARYEPRWFLEQFYWGVVRSFSYKLVDDGQNAANKEDNYGLVRFDGSNKPAFTCIKNLLDIVRDTGVAFTPEVLNYAIQGTLPSTVHHVLLQKRNHTFYLVLWNDAKNSSGGTNDIQQANIPATVVLTTPISRAATYLPILSNTAQSSAISPSSIAVSIPDNPLVLELVPVNKGNFRPAVSISWPKHDMSLNAGVAQTITANASDCDGTVQKVAFYNGTALLGEDATAPYSFSWNSIPAGDHVIKAIAFDNLGISDTSAPVTIYSVTPSIAVAEPANDAIAVPLLSIIAPRSLRIVPSSKMSFPLDVKIYSYQGRLIASWMVERDIKSGIVLHLPAMANLWNLAVIRSIKEHYVKPILVK